MSLSQYKEYKNSGVDWLGSVPAQWNVVRLKSKVSLVTDKATQRTYPVALENIEGWSGRFISTEGEFEGDGVAFAAGDLLFGKLRPYLAKAYLASCPGEAVGDFHVLRSSKALNPRFLQYQILNKAFIDFIDGSTFGSKMPRASWESLGSMALTLPSLEEQAAIAVFLDRDTAKIDALIAEQEKLIALLAEKRQATISHAVTKGLNPNAPMKDSSVAWLGEVPAHWKVTRLKFIATVQTGIAKGKDTTGKETITVPYLRVANVQDGYLALNDIATIEIEVEQLDRYRLIAGDVLMNEGGDFDKLGRGAIWHGGIADCIHQNHVFAVRPHGISAEWLNRITSAQYAQFYFMGRSKQSTNLASISATNIMELPVVLPPQKEQQAILEFIDSEIVRLDTLTDQAQRAIKLLSERRAALIAAAVTGQIDVRSTVSQSVVENSEVAAA